MPPNKTVATASPPASLAAAMLYELPPPDSERSPLSLTPLVSPSSISIKGADWLRNPMKFLDRLKKTLYRRLARWWVRLSEEKSERSSWRAGLVHRGCPPNSKSACVFIYVFTKWVNTVERVTHNAMERKAQLDVFMQPCDGRLESVVTVGSAI